MNRQTKQNILLALGTIAALAIFSIYTAMPDFLPTEIGTDRDAVLLITLTLIPPAISLFIELKYNQ